MAISVCRERASAGSGGAAIGSRGNGWLRVSVSERGPLLLLFMEVCVFEQVARISGAVNTERWIKPQLTLSSVCSLELIILPFHSHTRIWRGKVRLWGRRTFTDVSSCGTVIFLQLWISIQKLLKVQAYFFFTFWNNVVKLTNFAGQFSISIKC